MITTNNKELAIKLKALRVHRSGDTGIELHYQRYL